MEYKICCSSHWQIALSFLCKSETGRQDGGYSDKDLEWGSGLKLKQTVNPAVTYCTLSWTCSWTTLMFLHVFNVFMKVRNVFYFFYLEANVFKIYMDMWLTMNFPPLWNLAYTNYYYKYYFNFIYYYYYYYFCFFFLNLLLLLLDFGAYFW